MNSIKRGLLQFLALSSILFILFWGLRAQDYLYLQATRTFKPFPNALFNAIFPIVFGILLALPVAVKRLKNSDKPLKPDLVSIITIGLPTLILGLTPLLYFYTFMGKVPLIAAIMRGYFMSFRFSFFCGIISGYVIAIGWTKRGIDFHNSSSI